MDDQLERDEFGRRRLTDAERVDLLDLPLTAIWSTLTPAGRIHSVPVHFVSRAEQLRVLTESDSVKFRNALSSGRATMCVETTLDGTDRRYVSAEGPVSVEPVTQSDLTALDRHYGRTDAATIDQTELTRSMMLVLTPEQWICWSDAD